MKSRLFFALFFVLVGLILGLTTGQPLLLGLLGLAVGIYLVVLDLNLKRVSFRRLIGGSVGGASGFLIGIVAILSLLQAITYFRLPPLELEGSLLATLVFALFATTYVGFYLGILAVKKMEKGVQESQERASEISPKLLDTSVIIDGRIAEIIEIGFLEGQFIVPKFIIKEMQNMADSGDRLKRERGRRGLDILNRMRADLPVDIVITDIDYPHIGEVDSKLVAAAEELGAKIATNDFNLNKVASLEGVKVLNINELSNAVKPVYIPGETFKIEVIKEGEEDEQGVGYLEDGTMVVVEDGKNHVGDTIQVTVTSVIQTSAGRMIFTEAGKLEE